MVYIVREHNMGHIMRFILSFFAVLLCLSATPALAAGDQAHAQLRLFSPVTATGDSKQVDLALEVNLEAGWKSYWRTPGDAGLAPVLDWTGSENFSHADILWPSPHRFTALDLDNFGYKGKYILPLKTELAEAGKPLAARLKVDILVCSDICVPETHVVMLDLPAGKAAPSADKAAFDKALGHLPQASTAFRKAWLSVNNENRFFLNVEKSADTRPVTDADLFVEHPVNASFLKPSFTFDRENKTLIIRSEAKTALSLDDLSAELSKEPLRLTFVDGDKDGDKGGDNAEEATLVLTASSATAESPAAEEHKPQINVGVIFFAFLGGLILNLMPCVLPVLSLKILSVMSHGGKESRREIFTNFMASAAGILFSFWLMASILSAMKAAGSTIGWGIQFQHPWFLAMLIAVVLAFAANMWGLFEIPLPRFIAHRLPKHHQEPTLTGHFLTGAFATLLATPCTAPFLGTAVGFALAGSVTDIFAIFTFLGLGLATPYILLALSPRLFKRLPKPGKWMNTLRKVLAVALLATALWLGNVLTTVVTQPTLDAGWEAFDEKRIAEALADDQTVIVDITADWCLTCKANKRLVLEQQDIIDAISADNIVRLQADWTHRDETIAAYLRKFGKYGIPFNIVYGPGAPDGIVLPELLSKRAVMDALSTASGE